MNNVDRLSVACIEARWGRQRTCEMSPRWSNLICAASTGGRGFPIRPGAAGKKACFSSKEPAVQGAWVVLRSEWRSSPAKGEESGPGPSCSPTETMRCNAPGLLVLPERGSGGIEWGSDGC